MNEGNSRVMLGMDFTGSNLVNAVLSLREWTSYAKDNGKYEVAVGVSTFNHRAYPMLGCPAITAAQAIALVKEHCAGVEVVYWDALVDQVAMHVLARANVASVPLWPDFSYGSVVNRLLLLAGELRCDYMVRVDPGTKPSGEQDFKGVMEGLVSAIGESDTVVSTGYDSRPALRSDFLLDGMEAEQCRIVGQITAIPTQSQVTGGAMFTSRLPGVPAPPFAKTKKGLTLVWGSDDGIYQLLGQGQRAPVPLVARFDRVGKPKSSVEYYRGVAGMIFLSQLVAGAQFDSAAKRVESFLMDDLKTGLLDRAKCERIDREHGLLGDWDREIFVPENVAPQAFLEEISSGWDRYRKLRQDWGDIREALDGKLISSIVT